QELDVLEQLLAVGRALAEPAQLEDRRAQPRAGRQAQGRQAGALDRGLRRGDLIVEPIDAGLRLGRARRRSAPDPLDLAAQERGALLLDGRLGAPAIGLPLEEPRVAGLVGVDPPAIELEDPGRDAIEEV